jgi:diguanylate cyclase (GGDEF)-like protein
MADLEDFWKKKTEELEAQLAKAQKQLELLAVSDSLTGLVSRRGVLEILKSEEQRAKRYNTIFSLLIIEIDKIYQINQSHGHECGDHVIQQVADGIQSILREVDVLSRWAGEEFLLILPETNMEGAKAVAEKILNRIQEEPMKWKEEELILSVSIGIARYNGSFKTNIQNAEAEKSKVKAEGGGSFSFTSD